jgi:hypothetical protein
MLPDGVSQAMASIIIPAFNEQEINSNDRWRPVMETNGIDFELIVVDDGSGSDAGYRKPKGARALKRPEQGSGASPQGWKKGGLA